MGVLSELESYVREFDSVTAWSFYRLNFLSPDTFMALNEYSNRFSSQLAKNLRSIIFNTNTSPLKMIIEMVLKKSIQKHGLEKVISIAKKTFPKLATIGFGMLTVSTVIKLISKNIVFDIISSAFFKKFISSGVGEKVATVSEFALASGITGLYKFEAMQIHSMYGYLKMTLVLVTDLLLEILIHCSFLFLKT